jgi:hypothetical protein
MRHGRHFGLKRPNHQAVHIASALPDAAKAWDNPGTTTGDGTSGGGLTIIGENY